MGRTQLRKPERYAVTTILLLGKDGQVGWELQRSLAPLGELTAWGRQQCDLADLASLRDQVRSLAPDVIVNAAAYTAVDRAETDAQRAFRINAEAPGILAQQAARRNAWLVHYSTDYVFDGEKAEPYREEDSPNPLSVYGASKLAGERAIAQSGCRHLIFRTSWVFAARGGNFAKTMLRLAGEREQLRVIADQVGAPSSAELIADVTALCLYRIAQAASEKTRSGLYHLSAAGETSWYDYARFLLETARGMGVALLCPPGGIEPIPATAYPVAARRPVNSRLDTAKLRQTFGLHLPPWQTHVERMLAEILAKER